MTIAERVEAHLTLCLGEPARISTARSDDGVVGFRVATFPNVPATDAVTLVTLGLSETPRGDPPVRQELLVCVWNRCLAESLYDTLFGLGEELQAAQIAAPECSILELPKPIVKNGPVDLLVYAPTYFAPALEVVPGDEPVEILWLIPLKSSEADFIGQHGLEAFEDQLAEKDPDLLDLRRPAIV